MKFESSIIEIIKKRQSKRSYLNKDLDPILIDQIKAVLQYYTDGLYGNKVEFYLIEKKEAQENHKVKLGTYGFIRGARYFIIGQVKHLPYANEDYAYLLEKIILYLTDVGLGTCWLGGTFKRSDISEILSSDQDMIIPAITPVGWPTVSFSKKESIIRWGAKSDSRKGWSELFFLNDFSQTLQKENAGYYADALEMIRRAPSASNKQPWRVLKTDHAFHFYLKRTPGYQKEIKATDLQKMDMGIAMAHFELACKELHLKGGWIISNPEICAPEIAEYCISWK